MVFISSVYTLCTDLHGFEAADLEVLAALDSLVADIDVLRAQ